MHLPSHKNELDTPALCLDLDKLESNVAQMADYFRDRPPKLRPHVKTHKSAFIAHKQMEAGAVGMTCAKVGEAEMLVLGGIKDVLIANQVVGATKIDRLTGLARHAVLTVAVDDPANVEDLSRSASARGASLRVLIEVDLGLHRCGVAPGEPAVALAKLVAAKPGLELAGIMGYEGHLMTLQDRAERTERTREAMGLLSETKRLIERNGLKVGIVSAGGTGTFDITGNCPDITEVQAGSYVTMDGFYRDFGMPFACALTVLGTVVSRPSPGVLITDVGAKSLGREFGPPHVVGIPGSKVTFVYEEGSKIELSDPSAVTLAPGDKVELLPTHGCTTISTFDKYHGLRGNSLELMIPVDARGASQ